MFRLAPDPKANLVQPEPIPEGTEVALYADCEVWRGSGRGEQDADNVWCPVIYGNQQGWANGLYLQMRDGRRMACTCTPRLIFAREEGHSRSWMHQTVFSTSAAAQVRNLK
jgi:hypothetical protein